MPAVSHLTISTIPTHSIYEFKTKIKQWCDMANLPQEFVNEIEDLDRKFSITFMLHKRFRIIMDMIFSCPPNEKKHSKYMCVYHHVSLTPCI